MPLHLYIEKHFQQNIHARQHGITMEIPPDEKTPKLESVEKDIITIGENEMPIYIYTPDPLKEGEEHYPLLIFFHGGTLIKGGIRSHDVSCRLLSILSGYKVIAVDYFSTPLSTSTVTNCYHITKWIVEHAQSFHGKQSDITIAGASIGATIATMIALHSIQTSEFHLTAFRKKSPILKECEGANSTNE